MLNFLKIIRPINLLIVAFTMWAIRNLLILGIVKPYGIALQMPELNFYLLILSVVCITAAGNVINDYFDVKIDIINRPKAAHVGIDFSRRNAIKAHFTLSAIGLLLGLFVAIESSYYLLFFIHPIAILVLWFYSSFFKRRVVLGNVVVAILAALVPLLVSWYELHYLKQYYNLEVLEVCLLGSSIPPNEFFDLVQAWVYGFAIFAFLLNLIREIQKDLADIVGDKEDGRISIPIKYGEQLSKVLVLLLMMLSILLVALAYKYFISNSMHLFYFLGFLIIPLSISGVFTFRASQRKDYLVAANISKLVMFFGILYAAVIYYSTL